MPLNIDAAREAEARIARGLKRSPLAERAKRLRILRQIRVGLAYAEALGGIPNLYGDYPEGGSPEDGGGRLFGVGEYHLQRTSGDARKALLSGQGLWDYDFASCLGSILGSLAWAAARPAPLLAEYIDHKTFHHLRLEEVAGANEATLKRVFLAMLNGARLTPSVKGTVGGALGGSGARAFFRDRFVSDFVAELKAVREAVLEWSKSNGVERWTPDGFYNCVGKFRPFLGTDGKRISTGRVMSHLTFGYEAWALQAALTGEQRALVLVFDGWVGPKVDTKAVVEKVRVESKRAFGFALNLKLKGKSF